MTKTFTEDIVVKYEGAVALKFDASRSALYIGSAGANEGDIVVRNGSGTDVFHFDASRSALHIGSDEGADDGGDIKIRDENGDVTIHLDGARGEITLKTVNLLQKIDALSEEVANLRTALEQHTHPQYAHVHHSH